MTQGMPYILRTRNFPKKQFKYILEIKVAE